MTMMKRFLTSMVALGIGYGLTLDMTYTTLAQTPPMFTFEQVAVSYGVSTFRGEDNYLITVSYVMNNNLKKPSPVRITCSIFDANGKLIGSALGLLMNAQLLTISHGQAMLDGVNRTKPESAQCSADALG
jgi:hypothetical protein